MRFFLPAQVILVLSCLPSLAQQQATPTMAQEEQEKQGGQEIGRGVICDTLEELKRYVALRGNGTETDGALQAVNQEAHAAACGVALVMFSPGARIGDMAVQGRLLSIIQINVHAFGNGPVWTKIPDTIRYTVTVAKGLVV